MNEKDKIKFAPLWEVEEKQIIDLMNNEMVGKLLPLLNGTFTSEDCHAFLKAKKQLWEEHGFGPWAFYIHGEFAGWGGLQPEQEDADFALVLHPNFWGWGKRIFNKTKEWAFYQMNIDSITILFPPNRQNSRAITRLGFKDDGQVLVDNEVFIRFRLTKVKK